MIRIPMVEASGDRNALCSGSGIRKSDPLAHDLGRKRFWLAAETEGNKHGYKSKTKIHAQLVAKPSYHNKFSIQLNQYSINALHVIPMCRIDDFTDIKVFIVRLL